MSPKRSRPRPRLGTPRPRTAPAKWCAPRRAAFQPETSFREGARVSVAPEAGEEITFYRIDDAAFRRIAKVNGKLCDLIVHLHTATRDVVMFVELKGGNVDDGIAQLASARALLEDRVKKTAAEDGADVKQLRGLLVCGGAAPRGAPNWIRQRSVPRSEAFSLGEDLRREAWPK